MKKQMTGIAFLLFGILLCCAEEGLNQIIRRSFSDFPSYRAADWLHRTVLCRQRYTGTLTFGIKEVVGFLCLHRFLRKIRSGKVSDDLKTFWVNNKEKILTLLICGAVFTGALSLVALISGAVMKLFGFQYKSVGSVILFFIIATVLSFPCNLISTALPKALYTLKKISRQTARILYLILDTVSTGLGLKFVDDCMSSVSATTLSIVIISFLLAVLGKDDFKKPTNEK